MIAIQVLGVSGHKSTNSLKINVLKALKELNLIAKVEEVSDIDQLIRYDISGIPAMAINGQLAFQMFVPGVEDLKILIRILTKPFKKKRIVKNVLVPTDFSETAKGAFIFAQSFLPKEVTIKVLHAFHPEVDLGYPYLGSTSEVFFKQEEKALQEFTAINSLSSIENNLSTKTQIVPELKVGFAGDVITQETKEGIDMVIMGGTGATNLLDKVFGSVATHVVSNARCPVLLVPKGCVFKGLKKVIFASNIIESDEEMIQNLVDLTWDYNAEIHLVHIIKTKQAPYQIISEQFEQLFQKKTPQLSFRFINIESKNILQGLQRYTQENDIDLMVMTTKHRGFIEEIFHKSITREMILNTTTPLLIMHSDRDQVSDRE